MSQQHQNQQHTINFNHDSNNTHQQLCWNCMKTGQLSCCDNCFRSFHKVCIRKLPTKTLQNFMTKNMKFKTGLQNNQIIRKFPVNNVVLQSKQTNSVLTYPEHLFPSKSNKPWLCEICLQRYFSLCLNCFEKIDEPQHNLMCSVCYRFVHADCSNIPQQLFRKSITIVNFEIKGIRNFVCGECFSKFKVGKVLRFERIATNQNNLSNGNQSKLTMIKHQYLFANTGLASPIHLGWVRSDLDNLKTIKPEIFKERTIVEIVAMKCPLKYSEANVSTILDKFFEINKNTSNAQQRKQQKEQQGNRRFYGHYDNFKFLCRWDGSDYHNLSWQDEIVVLKYQVPLRKYLYYKIIQHRPLQPKQQPILSILPIKNSFIHQDDLPLLKKLQQRYQQYQTQIFTVRKQEHITKYSLLCHLINYLKKVHLSLIDPKTFPSKMPKLDSQRTYINWQKFYKNSMKIKPIIIICTEKNVSNWEKYFKICCPVLDVLYYCGSQANIKSIRLKKYFDFHNSKFHVYLISFEIYQKETHREFFINIPQIAQSQLVIVDQDQPLSFFSIKSSFKSKILYLVRRDASSKVQLDIKDKIIQLHGLKDTIQYTTTTQEIMTDLQHTIQQKKKLQQKLISVINQDVIKYATTNTLSQLKRIAFLRYVMCFGINIEQKQQIYNHICKFAPTIFTGQVQQKKIVLDYFVKFLALLYQYSNPYIDQRYIKFYLFDFERAEVYKRICQIYKLKRTFQTYTKTPQLFPIEKSFQLFVNNQLLKFHMWNNLEDYILVGLLLEKGYGRWETILQSKNWTQCIKQSQIYTKYMNGKQKQQKYKDHIQNIVISQTKQINSGNLYKILEDRFALYLKIMK